MDRISLAREILSTPLETPEIREDFAKTEGDLSGGAKTLDLPLAKVGFHDSRYNLKECDFWGGRGAPPRLLPHDVQVDAGRCVS